jgi:hypothetical protein
LLVTPIEDIPMLARIQRSAAAVVTAVVALSAAPTRGLAATQLNPGEHLAAARLALDRLLNTPAPTAETLRKLADVDSECRELQRAASARSPEWEAHYRVIDRLAAELLEPTVPAGVFGAVGTSGTIGTPTLTANAYMTTDLQTFRAELAAFAQDMAALEASAPSTAPTAMADAPMLVGLDSVSALLDAALKANTDPTSRTVVIDRALLEQAKRQLDQIRQTLKKP